jgi:hypothetical protein
LLTAVTASAIVMVLPTGTFLLTGIVSDGDVPVGGATVTVTAGQGAGLSASTSVYDGSYLLYGVAGDVRVQVSKDGYATAIRTLTINSNGTADFTLAQSSRLDRVRGAGPVTSAGDVKRIRFRLTGRGVR